MKMSGVGGMEMYWTQKSETQCLAKTTVHLPSPWSSLHQSHTRAVPASQLPVPTHSGASREDREEDSSNPGAQRLLPQLKDVSPS